MFLLPGWVAVLFSCVGEVGGTTVARKGLRAHSQRRGNQRPGEEPRRQQQVSRPPPKKPGETLQRAAAGVPRNGVPRQPSHTLHWNRRPKRSSGEAHSTRLSKPKHGPQKATDFGYRAGRFMRPLTRQNHHSGCSMLIGCDAHNQNTFRDPEKQKPPRPESG